MERMQPVTCLPRKPFFRSLTPAELNIHTISSASILNRLSPASYPYPDRHPRLIHSNPNGFPHSQCDSVNLAEKAEL
jgi:hypothetical protein